MNIQFWINLATIASPIISCIAIYVALVISRNSSKDMKNLIESNRIESDNQIKAIRTVSLNEIRQLRVLSHSLLIAFIHSLDKENLETDKEKQYLQKTLTELLAKYEELKVWNLDEQSDICIDEINSHFSQMYELEDSLLSLIDKFKEIGDNSKSITIALEKLKEPIQIFCDSQQR